MNSAFAFCDGGFIHPKFLQPRVVWRLDLTCFSKGRCLGMKSFIVLLMVLGANVAMAQTSPPGEMFKTIPKVPNPELLAPAKPNTIQNPYNSAITYSGIIPQAIKTDNPLQLINPFAPMSYGNGADNLDRDIVTGRPNGLKFFSLGF